MMFQPEQAEAKVRLFAAADLAAGRSLAVAEGQAHYLTRVMRLGIGEPVRIFNGRDGEWLGRIVHLERATAIVEIERLVRAQEPEAGPWLVFAPVKKSATDYIVEKATELGASRIWPVMTERTIAARVNVARLSVIAVEAAEQCERLSVPELAPVATLSELAAGWPGDRPLLVAHTGADPPAKTLLDALAPIAPLASASPSPAAGFLVGPEGGLTRRDLDVLASLPCAKVVHLGPRTLRAETAAAAVLACWQAVAGDCR
jgi:16S rRNA (uracil1498-N3)-methyltransferase